MRAEAWDALSVQARVTLLKKFDRTMRDKRWEPLLNRLSTSRFSELTSIQQDLVKELK
jgi:hypothetical protein